MKLQRKILTVLFALILLLTIVLCACDINQDGNKVKDSRFDEYSLAYGVNALESQEALGQKRLSLIFDLSKFPSDSIKSVPLDSTEIEKTEKSSIYEMMYENNSKITNSTSIDVGFGGFFSAGYTSKYSLSNSIKKENLNYQYFFQAKHFTKSEAYQLNGTVNSYKDYLSEEFLADLAKLNNESNREAYFIKKYGTHIISSVVRGGLLEIYYSLFSSEEFNSQTITNAIMIGISASIKTPDASGSISNRFEEEIKTTLSDKQKYTTNNFYIRYKGGKVVPVMSFDDVAESYNTWVDSLNDENNLSIVDVYNDGLTPIWDYFPNGFEKAKQKIMNYVKTETNKNAKSILAKLSNGTEENPYRIYTKEDFVNMLQYGKDGAKKVYSLEDDLDLGLTKSCIYWDYNDHENLKENAFQGIFKGNGHTIKYVINANGGSTDSENKNYAYGLFPLTYYAVIKDLNVQVDSTVFNRSARSSFSGGVIGYAYKTECENCTVLGEINQTDIKCPNGYTCTAGIMGFANGCTVNYCYNYAKIYSFHFSKQGKAARAGGILVYNKGANANNTYGCHNYSEVISYSGNNNPSSPLELDEVSVN